LNSSFHSTASVKLKFSSYYNKEVFKMATITILGLEEARKMVDAMVEFASKRKLVMSVAAVDNTDTLVCFAKMDGASPNSAQVSINKAHTAVRMKRDTAALADYLVNVKKDPTWFLRWGDPRLAPIPGGVLIKSSDGSIIGAVGTSGGLAEEDEEVAQAGAKAYQVSQSS
jgi:uncharacterized protein GlcG (DUF336 family)